MVKQKMSSGMTCCLVAVNTPAAQFHQHWMSSCCAQGRALGPGELKAIKTGPLVLRTKDIHHSPACLGCTLAVQCAFYKVSCISEAAARYQRGHRIWTQNAWI